MWRFGYEIGPSVRIRTLPALARDLGAAVVVLGIFAAAAALPLMKVPAAALVLLPVLLFAAVVFGRDSAVLAALLATLAARTLPFGEVQGSVGLLPIALLSGAALAAAALLEELRRSRVDTATAHLRSDETARSAARRVEETRRQLREAEARLAEAERRVRQAAQDQRTAAAGPAVARKGGPDRALDCAFRSEGGI